MQWDTHSLGTQSGPSRYLSVVGNFEVLLLLKKQTPVHKLFSLQCLKGDLKNLNQRNFTRFYLFQSPYKGVLNVGYQICRNKRATPCCLVSMQEIMNSKKPNAVLRTNLFQGLLEW